MLNKYITSHFIGEIAQTACAQADELTDTEIFDMDDTEICDMDDTEICDMDDTSSVDFHSSNIGQ